MTDESTSPTAPPSTSITDPIVGIDLGTTNSLVAWCDQQGPRVLDDPKSCSSDTDPGLLPSVVRIDPDTGAVMAIGWEAHAHAVEHAGETIFSVKRLMGRGMADVKDELGYLPYQVVEGDLQTARIRVGSHVFAPQQISAMILQALRARAEEVLGVPVHKAVVTVPAYFDDAQRQATRDAGRIAGLQILRIVNEPTAAALAYNIGHDHDDATVAVYDLGGGTFDVSILRLQQTGTGVVDQVLATAGDTHLGGDDVDRKIVALVQREVQQHAGREIEFSAHTRQTFRQLAQEAKVRLSQAETTEIHVELQGHRPWRRVLGREELETMIEPWVQRTLDCCERALKAAKLEVTDIDRVILVGGSTRIPLVRQRVAGFFGLPPYVALDPDRVVALGAAVQGSILAGLNRDRLLLDVIPLSLGIETMGGAVAKLIMANSTIPARATEMFSTYADHQTTVKIHVLQGERELVADCRSLGQFELRGIPPMPAGLPKIEVTFLVDANGVLSVQAVEKRSEKAARIQLIPNHGLTRQEVAQIEAQSLQHAQQDMVAHRLIDLRNQARLDIRAIQKQLAKVGDAIDPSYRQQILELTDAVESFIEADHADPDRFQQTLTRMDHATIQLAETAIQITLSEKD